MGSGWQPRDLLHVSQRIDRRAAVLAADLVVEQLRRTDRYDLAPDGWREQLESTTRRVRDAGLRPADGTWSPLQRLVLSGVGQAEALSATLRFQVRTSRLGPLTATLPPPATWTGAARSDRARARPAPVPPTPGGTRC